MDIGMLILRLVVGFTMAAHGAQKLFGWFGGYGLAGTGGFFEKLGFRPGKLQAFLAGVAEFGGGLLLAAGLATPVAAALIITVMVAAVGSIHLPKGFFNTNGGYEFNLVIVAAALALAFAGPGLYSLDAAEYIVVSGTVPGLAALVTGLVLGGAALLGRKAPASATAG
jgi:putative oxidoreductase